MSWNNRAAAFVVLLLGLVGAGCGGSSEEDAEARWANEFFLLAGSFEKETAEGKRGVAEATTRPALAAAYESYEEVLRDRLRDIEELDPPKACEDEQSAMESFTLKTIEVTEELADQSSLDQVRLDEIQGEVKEAQRSLYETMRSAAENEGC
jgi:hypothetical protein